MKKRPITAFQQRISRNSVTDPSSGCIVWLGERSQNGYGKMKVLLEDGRRVLRRVHRIAYECANGPIPEGLVIDHLCRNRACCNVAHLELVTPKENTLRGNCPSARNARATHCVHGHEFTPENTRRDRRQRRCCIACEHKRTEIKSAMRREMYPILRAAGKIRRASWRGHEPPPGCAP